MKLFFLAASFFVFALPAFSQTVLDSEIKGRVTDRSGAAISEVTVQLFSPQNVQIRSARTSTSGEFAFEPVPEGSYVVVAVGANFSSASKAVRVEPGRSAANGGPEELAIELDVALIAENVTVTADTGVASDKRNTPQPVTVISAEAIAERATSVLAQAGEEEAGLNLQRTSPTLGAIVVRGLTGKNVVNFVDGVRYTNGAQRGGINTFFNLNEPSVLQSIEVLRGPNSAQYGSDSLAGTVNLITRTPPLGGAGTEFHGEVMPGFSTADRAYGGSGLFSVGGERFGGYVNLAGRRSGNLRTADGIDSHSAITRFLGLPSTVLYDRNPDTSFRQYSGATKWAFAPSDDQHLVLFYERSQQDGGKRFDQLIGGDGNLIADLRNLMLDLGYVRYVKQGLGFFDSGSITASWNSQREERVNQGGQGNPFGDITHQYERTSTAGVSGFVDKRIGSNTILIGGDFYHEKLNSPAYIHNPVTNAVTLSRPRVPDEARFDSGGVYIQDQWDAVPDRLRLTGAVRYSGMAYRVRSTDSPLVNGQPLWGDDELRTSGFSGRIGAVVRARDDLTFAFNYGRGFRYPSMTDLGTLGLTGDGFEVDHITAGALGGQIGTTAGADAVTTGLPVAKQESEFSNNFDFAVRYQRRRFDAELTIFRLDIVNAITKQALILPQGAVGQTIAGQTITSQTPGGAVFVPAATNPVLVRANFSEANIWGVEYETEAKIRHDLTFQANFTYIRAADSETGLPPNIEGGTPPPNAFLSLRYDRSRFWVEAYTTLAAKQDRLSSLDLGDRRTGAARSRAQIENFFRRGACVAGLTLNAAGTCNANVNTYTLIPTGENITQVLTRVLGPGFPTTPLFTHLPGYGIANLRGGVNITEKASVYWAFENIFDQFYRNPSWGIDGPGRSVSMRLRYRF